MIHSLYGMNLHSALLNGGFVHTAVLHSKQHPEGVAHLVIDFAVCNPEKWNAELQSILATGVIDCGQLGPDGNYGVRRDYTDTEKAELSLYPVQFSIDGNTMRWNSEWSVNDTPALYASCALPDNVLLLDVLNTYCFLKNGAHIPQPESATPKEDTVSNTPADSVARVIRCKDCKYYMGAETLRCCHPHLEFDVECYDHWLEMQPDDFCSYGTLRDKERKENEQFN